MSKTLISSKTGVDPTSQEFTLQFLGQLAYAVVNLNGKVYLVNVLFWVDPKNQEKRAAPESDVANYWREPNLTWRIWRVWRRQKKSPKDSETRWF